MLLRLIVVVVCCCLPTTILAQIGDPSCQWTVNLTDIQELPQHRYIILEDCLYYNLSQEADRESGKSNSLMLLPPTKAAGDKITFQIQDAVVRQVWMDELWRDMTINGYMKVSWNDHRLKWNQAKWKLDSLNIKTYGHLWVPDVNSQRYQTASQDFVMFQSIRTNNNGNVSANFEYRMQSNCETDFENFPQDVNRCCFTLKSTLFENVIQFKVEKSEGRKDPESGRSNWDLRDIELETEDDTDRKRQRLRFCLKAYRQSSTLRIELTVPIVLSATLMLLAPLFGTMKHQTYVKLFALLLQFLCFQFLVSRTPQVGLGDATPKLYRFYEFTVAMTMLSLIITLICNAVANVERAIPPPHRAVLLSTALNNYLCCGSGRWEYSNEGAEVGKSAIDYRRDWREIFVSVNSLCSLALLISYVIGVVILTA